MAAFSTNQNRQLYVAKTSTTSIPTTLGQVQVGQTKDGSQVFFKHYGAGGLNRTDLIEVKNITQAQITKAADMAVALKQATITLNSDINDGEPVSAQDYIVNVYIHNFIAMGDDSTYIKHGAVHAYNGMSASTFYAVLALSLAKNFSKEASELFAFYLKTASSTVAVTASTKLSELTGTYTGVIIKEVEQPWILGTYQYQPVNFEVTCSTITYNGDEVLWADLTDGKIPVEETSDTVGNGKKIADLEYFCHGERGDQYRNMGWPNSIPTTYEVDPDLNYDVLDIHYSFTDAGMNNQASEKTITFVAPTSSNAVLTTILAYLKTAGATTEGTVTSA